MKTNHFFASLLIACLLAGKAFSQQNQAPYQLPEAFKFDYEVVQTSVNNKSKPDTTEIHYFFTKSGDYAGARFAGKPGLFNNNLVVLTKDGNTVIFNEAKKTIHIIRVSDILADVVNLAKDFASFSFPDTTKHKMSHKKMQMEKTGKTKLVSGYTAEEYKIWGNNDSGYVWYAKVDFNTQSYYMLAMGGPNPLKAAITGMSGTNPLLLLMTDPKELLIETDLHPAQTAKSFGGAGFVDIRFGLRNPDEIKKASTVSTSGYLVKNYSNMGLKEIIEAERQNKSN
ncbi:MAG TPA: hypothetical protein VMH01_02085 [Puia sp.]|nr:hypothetical protein [Puia sp.]